jgi:hypothetical protein
MLVREPSDEKNNSRSGSSPLPCLGAATTVPRVCKGWESAQPRCLGSVKAGNQSVPDLHKSELVSTIMDSDP